MFQNPFQQCMCGGHWLVSTPLFIKLTFTLFFMSQYHTKSLLCHIQVCLLWPLHSFQSRCHCTSKHCYITCIFIPRILYTKISYRNLLIAKVLSLKQLIKKLMKKTQKQAICIDTKTVYKVKVCKLDVSLLVTSDKCHMR